MRIQTMRVAGRWRIVGPGGTFHRYSGTDLVMTFDTRSAAADFAKRNDIRTEWTPLHA